MRHGLRSGGEGISFFFFQDIITCLIGIVLFIALLLTLFAGENASENRTTNPGSPASADQKKRLNELIAKVVQARKDVKTAILSGSTDQEIAQKSVAARAELEDLRNQLSRYSGAKSLAVAMPRSRRPSMTFVRDRRFAPVKCRDSQVWRRRRTRWSEN